MYLDQGFREFLAAAWHEGVSSSFAGAKSIGEVRKIHHGRC